MLSTCGQRLGIRSVFLVFPGGIPTGTIRNGPMDNLSTRTRLTNKDGSVSLHHPPKCIFYAMLSPAFLMQEYTIKYSANVKQCNTYIINNYTNIYIYSILYYILL